MAADSIQINIWDDYPEDGSVPAGTIQETYAYVEEDDLADDDQLGALLQLQKAIEFLKDKESPLVCSVEWFDTAAIYPDLVGTEHEHWMFKRWQLKLQNLTHNEREHIVAVLGRLQLGYKGRPLTVYSES